MTDRNNYEFRIFSPEGAPLGAIRNYSGVEIAYGTGAVGQAIITVDGDAKQAGDWSPFSFLEIWRTVDGRTYLEGGRLWHLVDVEDGRDSAGAHFTALIFADTLYYLSARRVLYAADSAQAQMTAAADDMLKSIVSQNLGPTATDTTRALSWITLEANKTAAPSISKGFAWQNVLEVMNDVCNQSRAAGTFLAYDFQRTGTGTVEFRTYTGQRGIDRGSTSASPLLVAWEKGNLREPSMARIRMGRYTHVTAAGTGTGSDRITQAASVSGITPMSRFEGYVDCRNSGNTTADVLSEATAELELKKPTIKFSGKLAENTNFRYGYDVNFGDKVKVEYGGYTFDAHLRAVSIRLDRDGAEVLDLQLRNYD